jgi:hypothetical protein
VVIFTQNNAMSTENMVKNIVLIKDGKHHEEITKYFSA